MVAMTMRKLNHEIRDPADAALELTLRNAARNGRRICHVCAEEKPLEEYPKAGRGRSYRCRACAIKAAEQIGEQRASTSDRHAPPADALDAREVAEEAAESAQRVAGIAEGVTALNAAIHGGRLADSDDDDDDTDPDVEHAELLDPMVTESIKRFVRGTVKGTAALMVRDLVKTAVREAAAAIVPELVTDALTVEMRQYPVPVVAAETPAESAPHTAQQEATTLPALVTALLERLPLQQRGWGCATERARWLAAFTAVLDVVFPVADGAGGTCVAVEEVTHVRA